MVFPTKLTRKKTKRRRKEKEESVPKYVVAGPAGRAVKGGKERRAEDPLPPGFGEGKKGLTAGS